MKEDTVPISTDRNRMTLLELVVEAIETNDPQPIAEILHHHKFGWSTKADGLTFPEFLEHLVKIQRTTGRSFPDEVWELAVDLTIEKFVLPPSNVDETRNDPIAGRTNPICYYRAFLDWVKNQINLIPRGKILQEAWVSDAFMRFIKRQFLHSCQEAKRRLADRFSSRYVWHVDGSGSITVRLPRTLPGPQRRKWLESNINNVDPSQPDERERIQSIIDRKLVFGDQVPLDQAEIRSDLVTHPPDWFSIELDGLRFPEFVAEEKVQAIDYQRPSIREIGPDKLRSLVLTVFDNLLSETYNEKDLAELFGLSKTAFSHFAGSKWYQDGIDKIIHVPDLWANVMFLLVHQPRFTDLAMELGFLNEASEVLKDIKQVRLGVETP